MACEGQEGVGKHRVKGWQDRGGGRAGSWGAGGSPACSGQPAAARWHNNVATSLAPSHSQRTAGKPKQTAAQWGSQGVEHGVARAVGSRTAAVCLAAAAKVQGLTAKRALRGRRAAAAAAAKGVSASSALTSGSSSGKHKEKTHAGETTRHSRQVVGCSPQPAPHATQQTSLLTTLQLIQTECRCPRLEREAGHCQVKPQPGPRLPTW